MKRRLDWALHAGAGFCVGFWGGMAALAIWLAWMASRDERAIRDRDDAGWP